MGLGFSGADIMSLPPDMLRTIMQLLQSGQWGTPQGFEQLFAGPSQTGQGAQIAGRKNWMRKHPQFDPFGWEEFTRGTDFDPYSKPRAMTPEELGGALNPTSRVSAAISLRRRSPRSRASIRTPGTPTLPAKP